MIGRRYAGFPDERRLDVGRFQLFEQPLKRRFTMFARTGFDAVEPDNIAGWEPENKTGFHVTRADQLRFSKAVFEAGYEQRPKRYCKTALAIGFGAIHKSYDLFARPWQSCGRLCPG